MKRLVIKNGRVIDPSSGLDGLYDLYIYEGKVASLRPSGGSLEADEDWDVLDAKKMLVLPGLIDIHTHLRDPGYEYKETIATGTMAAAAGGFTSIVCMANTNPVNDNGSVTRFILNRASEVGKVNVFPVGAATRGLKGEMISEMGELRDSGCVAVSDDGMPIIDGGLMRKVLEYSSVFDMPVISHCEDPCIVSDGVMNEGSTSTRLGLKGIPRAAEEAMVARDIVLAELTRGRLHIAHISTRGSVELVRTAKDKGLSVTTEVTPHHFTLTDDSVVGYNTSAKMNPPLRDEDDIEAILQGLKDRTIDCIATDHAPHSSIEKDLEFDRAANGVVGLETALSLTLRLVDRGFLGLSEAIERVTVGPATVLGLEKGTLKVGADADITIVDKDREWIVDSKLFFSKGRNTPFEGWGMKGKVVKTIVKGKVVYSLGSNLYY
ncbi:MAG: dihydroorotase [Thermodesulfobacteriota bacterium]